MLVAATHGRFDITQCAQRQRTAIQRVILEAGEVCKFTAGTIRQGLWQAHALENHVPALAVFVAGQHCLSQAMRISTVLQQRIGDRLTETQGVACPLGQGKVGSQRAKKAGRNRWHDVDLLAWPLARVDAGTTEDRRLVQVPIFIRSERANHAGAVRTLILDEANLRDQGLAVNRSLHDGNPQQAVLV